MTRRDRDPGTVDLSTRAPTVVEAAEAAIVDVDRFIARGTREFRLTNVALFASGFTTFALIYCVQPIMPVFSQEFGIGAAAASLSLSITTQCLAVSMLIASSLSEVFGRKPVMVTSLCASSLLVLASAFAPNWQVFLVLRALAGIAFSGLPATAMAYVGEEMETRSLGLAMGLYIGGTGLGALGGRLIVGILTDVVSWRAGMLTIGLLALGSSLIFTAYLPRYRHFVARPFNIAALGRSFAAHLRDPIQLLLYLEGFLLLGIFVALYNYIGYRLMAPPYGFSQTTVGLIFLLSLVGIVSSAWVGDLAGRLGRGRVFWVFVAIMLGGMGLTLFDHLAAILVGLAIVTFAFYAAHSVASSWVGVRAKHAKAQASSLYLFSYYSGSSVIGSLGGLAWQHDGWLGVVLLGSIVLMIALAAALVLARSEPPRVSG
ncbi:MFS transporter [Lichenihabitans psoromatis]|uniref:MFS transporter n=1 Tax=Lichenihabitans psoromatis TaxID=2528642 RepID=UPI00103855DA|nr:MFS transporter [Lichenihabitans psoromatis]